VARTRFHTWSMILGAFRFPTAKVVL